MSIAVLPVELISKICNHLDYQQLVALRLSCRALYQNSLENFGKTYFRKIRFIVTSEGLHELEALSKSNGLREHVQELWMIPVVFDGAEGSLGMISISSKSCRQVKGDELESRRAVQKDMLADNRNLLESETFSLRLRECMDRFKNIQTIGLAHYRTEFLLDPRQQTVPFLGRRQMMSRIDFRFDVYSLQESTRTHQDSQIRKLNSLALSKLFLALCGSSCRPRKLSTCDSKFCCDIGPRIALSEEQFDSLLSTLEDLEDLHLCIDLDEAAWLKLFRKIAPQLEVLTLSQHHMPFDLVQDDMHAYPAKSYVGNMFHDISFTRLRNLHIKKLDIDFSSLRSLLLSVKKGLVTLTVKRVRMRSEESGATENPRSQDAESPDRQENERSVRYTSPLYQPTVPSHQPTSPYDEPTVPPYQPTSPYNEPTVPPYQPTSPYNEPTVPPYQPTSPYDGPTVPPYQPTSPYDGPSVRLYQPNLQSYGPTVPSFQPTPPSFSTSSPYRPTVSPQEYGPAPLSVLPASETASAESAPQSPQHSSASDSSEASTEEYWSRKWMSTYHPYEPSETAGGFVCPTRETVMAWKRNEEKITSVPSFLKFLRNELSLETLSLEDIICDDNYYDFERIDSADKQRGKVDFDIHKANISLKDWISRLRPIASCPADRIINRKEDKG
ncbi:hypothetical protein PENANT_c223G02143 [Penicillium antarcticum]|uniref:F-box domain-containing protein n=2 Tax=Penicillium antarcticum TaxID=416450 RepID=A0A1V6P8C5_9EURO|nr:hypothetical protein PENANT_c223G02143 [Penicillium antarcticum]